MRRRNHRPHLGRCNRVRSPRSTRSCAPGSGRDGCRTSWISEPIWASCLAGGPPRWKLQVLGMERCSPRSPSTDSPNVSLVINQAPPRGPAGSNDPRKDEPRLAGTGTASTATWRPSRWPSSIPTSGMPGRWNRQAQAATNADRQDGVTSARVAKALAWNGRSTGISASEDFRLDPRSRILPAVSA